MTRAEVTVYTIVVAAGGGSRFGAPKQFAPLGGVRVVDHAVAAARAVSLGVVVVLPPAVEWDGDPLAVVATGGKTRSASVRAGLDAVPDGADVIVVHDAARPLASVELFVSAIDAIRAGADGAVPALAVPDTIKRVDGITVTATVAREGLVTVQTPQAFWAVALRAAHAEGTDGTDDAALVEAAGGRVVTVPGARRNLKITEHEDLVLAAALLVEARS